MKKSSEVKQISKDLGRNNLYKAWVDHYGSNIELLDRLLDKIMNICKAHPKEVLTTPYSDKGAFLWQLILIYLFDLLTHGSLRKKKYCKRHLKLKIVSFVRCIMIHVPFEEILK
jgi:hypothetical protein